MRQIGRYEITRELGRGAMGVVYEARDPLIRRTVAIKTLHVEVLRDPAQSVSNEDPVLHRILREAQAAGALSHPGIVVVHDVGYEQDFAYIAMECVEGPTLREIITHQRLPPSRSLQILQQVAEALDYAHEKGVVHRDIKPGNIMLHQGSIVKITDFGLARMASQHQTTSESLQGTPSYMAPEQIRSQPLDGRADQFSLAVTAFEMLTGARPFSADSVGALMHNILTLEPPPVGRFAPELPSAVSVILRRALAKSPERRYSNCLEFVNALDDALANASGGDEPTIIGGDERSSSPQTALVPKLSHWRMILSIFATAMVVLTIALVFWPSSPGPGVLPVSEPVAPPPAAPPPTLPDLIDVKFDAQPAAVDAGQAVTLQWEVKGASEISIDGLGTVPGSGRRSVFPKETVMYTLTARGGSKSRAVSVEVKVRPAPVPSPATNAVAVPSGGTIVWTGRLAPGEQLIIRGGNASAGTLSSPLPEALVQIDFVSPSSLRAVEKSPGKLVLQNAGTITETLATIRWTAQK